MKILVVDDDLPAIQILGFALRDLGYEVTTAFNGVQALERMREHDFRIVIADWVMPEMDGIELCRTIRSRSEPGYVFFILLTARTDKTDRLIALQAGADDFLTKPYDRSELSARLGTAIRILEAEEKLHEATLRLEQAREQERAIGAEIQRALLTPRAPAGLSRLEVGTVSIPSQQIDGDFYDFIVHGRNHLDVIVGDAMGKGIPAALVGAGTKSAILHTVNALYAEQEGRLAPPETVLQRATLSLTPEFIALESFVTMVYARFDLTEMEVELVACGHPPVLRFRAETGEVEVIDPAFAPIGFLPNEAYASQTRSFQPDDVFVIVSDGVTEAGLESGEMFGIERAAEVLAEVAELPADAIVQSFVERIAAFSGGLTGRDDLTLVAIKILRDARPTAPEEATFESQLAQLAAIRDFVSRAVFLAGTPRRQHDELLLAVNEAVTNVMRHAHFGMTSARLNIRVVPGDGEVRVELLYEGEPFAPEEVMPDLENPSGGGLGLYIIRQSVDEVRYEGLAEGANRVSLLKRFGDR